MYLKNAALAPRSRAPHLLAPPREMPIGSQRPRAVPGAPGSGLVWILLRGPGLGTAAGQASRQNLCTPEPLLLPDSGARPASPRSSRPHPGEETPNESQALRPQPNAAPSAAQPHRTSEPAPRRADVVPGFLSLVGSIRQQVQAAAAAEDWPLAERLAHSLKHTACSYGFHQISDLTLRLTQAAAAADLAGLRSAADQLEQCRREAVRLPAYEAAALLCGQGISADGACAVAARAAGA
jgi:hypothetical protein